MKVANVLIGLAAGTLALVPSAAFAAGSFTGTLNYTLESGSVLDAVFHGELDGDLFTVTEVKSTAFDGVDVPGFNFFSSVDALVGLAPLDTPALLSLSGSTLDLIVCDSPLCLEGFLFSSGGFSGGTPVFQSSSPFGSASELVNVANYTLTVESKSTPEPATLLGLGVVVGFGYLRRRANRLSA